MPLPNFHSARVKSSTSFKVLLGKKGKFRTKRIAKGITISELADRLRNKLGEVA